MDEVTSAPLPSPHKFEVKCSATSQKSPLMRKLRSALPIDGGSGISHVDVDEADEQVDEGTATLSGPVTPRRELPPFHASSGDWNNTAPSRSKSEGAG